MNRWLLTRIPRAPLLPAALCLLPVPSGVLNAQQLPARDSQLACRADQLSNPGIPDQAVPAFGPTIYLNPLGFLQFGPTLGVEIPAGSDGYLDLHVRMQGLGALMHAIWDDTKARQLGFGGGYRAFLGAPGSRNRYHVGGLGEFVWSPYGKGDREGRALGVVLAGQFGHRWRRESGIFFNLGVLAGSYTELSDKSWNVNTPDQKTTEPNESGGFGMLEFSIGFEWG